MLNEDFIEFFRQVYSKKNEIIYGDKYVGLKISFSFNDQKKVLEKMQRILEEEQMANSGSLNEF